MKLYIDKKIRIGFTISVLVLIVLGINSFFYVRQVIFSSESGLHFQQALMNLERIESANARIDVSQLEFSIKGEKADSVINSQAITDLQEQINELEYLITNDTAQQKKLAQLREAVVQKISLSRQAVGAKKENPESSSSIMAPSKGLNQRISQLVKEIGRDELSKKKERQIEVTVSILPICLHKFGSPGNKRSPPLYNGLFVKPGPHVAYTR
ncbi:MAG: CHASE3 domain-containing protein [Bacteroidota bacterium]